MLVGVPSHRHAVALQRREAIRELCACVDTSGAIGPSSADTSADAAASSSAASTAITLRFVMAQDQADVDRDRGDVWLFDLPAARRTKKTYGLEKYLLSNRFLRTAAARKDTPLLVVLADDDTLFNATLLAARMAPFARLPSLVFGNVEEWFMWDPVAMISTCFAYSSRRWELAQESARNVSTIAMLSRSKQECLRPQAVGPFPYAKGHFLGYSRPMVQRLVTLFDCCGDEAYALGPRASRAIMHPFYNVELKPSHPNHPANQVLTEDVYYMHLLYRAMRNESLTLVHLTLSEYVVARGSRALYRADVYHRLKRPERWEYARQWRAQLLQPLESLQPRPRCATMASKYRIWRGGQLVARLEHCCQNWRWCDLSPLPSKDARRNSAAFDVSSASDVSGIDGLPPAEDPQLSARLGLPQQH